MKRRAALAVLLPLLLPSLLAACSAPSAPTPTPTPTPPASIFSAENTYADALPEGATAVSPAEFERLVRSGELILSTPANTESAAEREARTADLRARLAALPNRSDALNDLLQEPVEGVLTPSGDVLTTAVGRDGQPFEVRTLGPAASLTEFASANAAAGSVADALDTYTSAYEALDAAQRADLPTPASLQGRPLAEIVQARTRLDDALLRANASDLDGAAETDPNVGAASATPGSGVDADATCGGFNSGGLWVNIRWPLKKSITSVKNQGQRGTCWAFSSVGAIEIREQVVGGRTVNLSEQHYNHLRKINGSNDEGDVAFDALNDLAGRNVTIAAETAWTYNPANRRTKKDGNDDGQKGVCQGYDGTCSETVPQSPQTCTEVLGLKFFCGYKAIEIGGVKASYATSVWVSSSGNALPVGTMKSLLSGGTPLILATETRPAFMNGGNKGYVTSLGGKASGGHAVLIVGYVSDAVAQKFASPPSMSGGTGGGWFIVKNSWGCGWGDRGYVYLPVRYLQRNGWEVLRLSMSASRSSEFVTYRNAIKGVPPVSTAGTVDAVEVHAASPTVASRGTVALDARVTGTGDFDDAVTWSIVSGGGNLSATSGAQVTLTAPNGPAFVVVRATSVADPSKFGELTLLVSAPSLQGLGGTVSPSPNGSATVRVADGARVFASTPLTSGATASSFVLSLPVPGADLIGPFDFTGCTSNAPGAAVPANPASVKHGGGSLLLLAGASTFRLVPTSRPTLNFFLLYVDQRVRLDMSCGTERYVYDFPAAGWYAVQVEGAGTALTYTGVFLSTLGTQFTTAPF